MRLILVHHDGRQETVDVAAYLVELRSLTAREMAREMAADRADAGRSAGALAEMLAEALAEREEEQ